MLWATAELKSKLAESSSFAAVCKRNMVPNCRRAWPVRAGGRMDVEMPDFACSSVSGRLGSVAAVLWPATLPGIQGSIMDSLAILALGSAGFVAGAVSPCLWSRLGP